MRVYLTEAFEYPLDSGVVAQARKGGCVYNLPDELAEELLADGRAKRVNYLNEVVEDAPEPEPMAAPEPAELTDPAADTVDEEDE
jgi:hypothetical protein